MGKDLTLELVRVTEAAAIGAGRLLGRGDKEGADQAAVDGMRKTFDNLNIRGTVVIGEGEIDEAPMLYIGEKVGRWESNDIMVDIAVDPLDGTELIAKGLPNAIAVIAAAGKGGLLHAPDMYMEKIAVGPAAAGKVSLDNSIADNIRAVAKALDKKVSDVTVVMLDRERHYKIMDEVRKIGARMKLIEAGDIAAAVAVGFEHTGIDILLGTGGAPEGVIAAAALKCLGGEMQGRLLPSCEEERKRCCSMGIIDTDKVLHLNDIVKGEDVYFAATGISYGELLNGVLYMKDGAAKTESVVMRAKTGTVRFINAIHNFKKICAI